MLHKLLLQRKITPEKVLEDLEEVPQCGDVPQQQKRSRSSSASPGDGVFLVVQKEPFSVSKTA